MWHVKLSFQARSTVHDHTWTTDSVHYTYKTYQTAYIVQHLRRHHQNSTETQQQKDTNCVIETACSWPGSTYVRRWLVSKFSQWCDTLFYICTTKQTLWAICALTIVHADENKRENQACMTLPIAVNIPPRLETTYDWPGSKYVHRWLVSQFSQWCDTLSYICTTKQTIWAIRALTKIDADENKQENRACVTLPIAVNIPPRLPAAKDRVVVAKRVHLCHMNSEISIRASRKSEVEGRGKGLTW